VALTLVGAGPPARLPPVCCGEIRTMGFNRRKMEAQRAAAAEKEAAAKRATEAQILEDAGRLVSAWNARQAKRMPMLFSPTIGAAIRAGYWPPLADQ